MAKIGGSGGGGAGGSSIINTKYPPRIDIYNNERTDRTINGNSCISVDLEVKTTGTFFGGAGIYEIYYSSKKDLNSTLNSPYKLFDNNVANNNIASFGNNNYFGGEFIGDNYFLDVNT